MKTPTHSSPAEIRERDVSLDALLGGRVRLLQPKDGLRAAIDPVLLAASVPAGAGQRVLEVGCGSGAAALCLAARVLGVSIMGLDVQADLVALACESADLNRVSERVSFVAGDLLAAPIALQNQRFDHVMANPPFARHGSGRVSPDPAKALASVEGAADLAAWVAFCIAHLNPGGSVTFIHRADRAGEVASLFAAAGLATIVFPLGPKRSLVQGNQMGNGSVTYKCGFDLHQADGRFSAEADAILRDGNALVLTR
jgi:tRNA1(Val) A37 N6-methylase TrmN6